MSKFLFFKIDKHVNHGFLYKKIDNTPTHNLYVRYLLLGNVFCPHFLIYFHATQDVYFMIKINCDLYFRLYRYDLLIDMNWSYPEVGSIQYIILPFYSISSTHVLI